MRMFNYDIKGYVSRKESKGVVVLSSIAPEDKGRYYIGKYVKKGPSNSKDVFLLKKEGAILEYVKDGPFMTKLCSINENEEYVLLVLELLKKQDLNTMLAERNFTEDEIKFIAAELIVGIEYLQRIGVIHTRIRPENIGIDLEGHVAVYDFNFAERFESSESNYELAIQKKHGEILDWWSFSITLHILLFGEFPTWDQECGSVLIQNVDSLSVEVVSLLEDLLHQEPNSRLGRGCGHGIKEHPFFQDVDWDVVKSRALTPPDRWRHF